MRHKGSGCDFIADRDRELFAVYRKHIREASFIKRSEILQKTVDSPSSRFWVSELRAAIVLADIFRGRDVLSKMLPHKREMYEEMFRRAKAIKDKNPNMTMCDIAWRVVNSPAPKFYLDKASAKIYIHYEKLRQLK